MDADHRGPACEAGEILIGARPETVWDTLTDLRTWPQWMPGVKTMKIDEPVRVGTTFQWKAGPGTIRSEIVESERPYSVAWKGRTLGISAVRLANGVGRREHSGLYRGVVEWPAGARTAGVDEKDVEEGTR